MMPSADSAMRAPTVATGIDTPSRNAILSPLPQHESSSPESNLQQRFEFTGTGGEYFRIWVVNVLLTIVTLGIYSAWAKVRRLQYFYRNTRVAGDIFDYHGNPKAILKGRALALVLLVAYKIAFDVSVWAALAVGLALIAIMPWLLARAFHFKLANSSYRGLRFRFQGTVTEAYRMLILFPVIIAFTGLFVWSLIASFSHRPSIGVILLATILPLVVLGGAIPMAHYLLKRYQHDNAYFGQAPFFFQARASDFFKIYGKAIGMLLLGGAAVSIFNSMTGRLYNFLLTTTFGWLFQFLYGLVSAYVLYLFIRPFLESRIQNLVWNKTELADHRFESTVSARKLLAIHATNLALIVITLGLYKPFAMVRLAQYRVASMALAPQGDFEEFLADQSVEHAGAVGQEAGDFFDIDIAL
jgi:uncharacterized membrane protein YjgN (DUF898 family)